MPVPPELVEEVARRFALLAEPTRLRILDALLERGDTSVTELAMQIGEAPANVSQHLSRLLADHIVSRRRDGRTVRYSIADPTIRPLCDLVCNALEWRARSSSSGDLASGDVDRGDAGR